MKANDLMIGDIVRQKISGITLQVEEIHPPFIYAKGQEGQFEDVEPVELTDEFFEKNGFEKNEQDTPFFTLLVYSLDQYELAVLKRPKGGWKLMHGQAVSSQQDLFFGEGKFVCMLIQYVHELQHVMKLCGIEKEIEL